MARKHVDMLSGNIIRGLIALSIPVMVMNVSQTLFNVIDMAVLGNLVSDNAVGAVGTCGTLITLTTCLLTGLSSGANVVIARNIGKDDIEAGEKALGTSLFTAVLSGVFLMIIGIVLAKPLLLIAKCPEALLGDAIKYFRLYFLSAPFFMIYSSSAAILRSIGETRRPMYFLLIAGVVKVILNFAITMLFDTTVEGVGIATIAANMVSGGLTLWAVLRNNKFVKFKIAHFKIYFKQFKQILFIGIPTGVQTALYSLANLIIMTVVNSSGPDAATGISIANQFDGILYNISCAVPVAAMPFIAQNVGAKNLKRVKRIIMDAILLTSVVGGGLGMLSAIFSYQLASLMTHSETIIAYAQEKMMLISSTYFICGINEIMNATMRGLNRPIVPTVSTMCFMCLIRFFWVYLIYPLCPNFTFLYLIWPIGWILCITTNLSFIIPTMKKLKKKFSSESALLQDELLSKAS